MAVIPPTTAGARSSVVPSGLVTRRPVAPAGMGSVTRVPGATAVAGGGRPGELADEVRDEHREGDLQGQVGASRLEREDGGRDAVALPA